MVINGIGAEASTSDGEQPAEPPRPNQSRPGRGGRMVWRVWVPAPLPGRDVVLGIAFRGLLWLAPG